MREPTNAVLLASAIIICILSLIWSNQSNKYSIARIVESGSLRTSVREMGPTIQSARQICEQIVNEYRSALSSRVDPTFKKQLPFWEAEKITARVVLSSVSELLIYLSPGNDSLMYVDLIQAPVQVALMQGLIHLDTPSIPVDAAKLNSNLSDDEIRWYTELSLGI